MSDFQFSQKWIASLTENARQSSRFRQHCNIHKSYDDPCQFLFNAIEANSYIHPHRHSLDPKVEYLVAIRGYFALVTFFDDGNIQYIDHFGSEAYQNDQRVGFGVVVPPEIWHTVIALAPDSVLIEAKSGPFSINTAKELAQWAPKDGSDEATFFLLELKSKVLSSTA